MAIIWLGVRMRKQQTDSKFRGMILIVMGMVLSACAPAAAASARSLYATPCHPPTLEGNVYRQQPVQSILSAYYQGAFRDMDFGNPEDVQRYQSMQHEAIKLLATQTKRWSDSIDIPLETKFIRITVTYLSPELIQTIILNHYLFRKDSTFFIDGTFESQVRLQLENIANRNEHLFFVTLTASYYGKDTSYTDPVIVQLPMQSLILTSASGIRVFPQHYDHYLEERVDLTLTPAHGYFAFPIAVNINGNCEYLLDKANNTHIDLSIPHIAINGTNHTIRPWMFDYVPPLRIASNPNPMEDRLQVERNPEDFFPCKDPPLSITTVDAEYWENLARFIWHEMTLDP